MENETSPLGATVEVHTGRIPPAATVPARPRRTGRSEDHDELQPVAPENYVLEEAIAEGGMGRILRARDRRLGRDVAIKELRITTPDLAIRFRREAQITARLQHPSIVTVHEAGVWPSGEPFFAMEMVAGRPLDTLIDETSTFEGRIALLPHVLAVADALAYAHSRGIIHRDLKPGNVLIGDFGETVVIDWGLARDVRVAEGTGPDRAVPDLSPVVTDGTMTVAGAVLGTPAYMPPEQALAKPVDERADVYAIGAMLYHLLAGYPPVDGESTNEILTRVIDTGAVPLAKAAPDVPADLAAIVDKAMARDPEGRYRTARTLAEDLRKYTTGQLVGAHRYTARERVRRFLKRYRLVVTIAAVAAVLLAAIGTYSVIRVVGERDRALQAQADAEAQRALAESRRQTAATQRAAAENLIDFMLADLKPGLERVGRLDTMRGVAREVDGYYNQLTEIADLDDAAKARRAEAVRTLGDVLDASGDVAGAHRSYARALKLLETVPVAGREPELARVLFNQAIALDEQGDMDAAAAALKRGHAVLAAAAASPDKELASARLHRWESVLSLKRGELADAEAALDRAIEHATAAVRGRPTDRAFRMELSKGHDRRCDVRRMRSEGDGAMADARASLAIREELAREDPQDLPVQFGLAISWDKVFHVSRSASQTADAEQAAAKQIAIAEMLVRHDPTNRDWGMMLLGAAERLGDLAFDRNDFADAVRKQERVVTFAQQIVDGAHADPVALADLAKVTSKLGSRLAFAGSTERSLEAQRRALAIYEDLSARFPTNVDYRIAVGRAHEARGDAYANVADAEGARAAYEASLAVAEEVLRADPTNPVRKVAATTLRLELGRALANLPDRRAEGIAMMTKALDTFHQMRDADQLSRESLLLVPAYEEAAKNYVYVRPKAH